MRQLLVTGLLLTSFLIPSRLFGQTTQPVTAEDPTAAITALRADLIDSFNKQDVPRLLSHLDPSVVVVWQNGEVCHGPAEVKAYYERMMTGPNRIVASATADPQVTGREIHGDWAVSYGQMNDRFTLTDGRELAMHSKFTATIDRRGGEWKVASFHASVNAFDNPILPAAVKKAAGWTAVIAGVLGLLVGAIAGRFLAGRRVVDSRTWP